MIKINYKILVLFITLSSVLTLNGHNFFHHHEKDTESSCYSCLISTSLITDKADSESEVMSDLIPEFTLENKELIIILESHFTAISDRAPPSA